MNERDRGLELKVGIFVAVGLAIASQDDRHVRGSLKGSGRLKLKGRAEIPLVPNRRAEVLARHAARELK